MPEVVRQPRSGENTIKSRDVCRSPASHDLPPMSSPSPMRCPDATRSWSSSAPGLDCGKAKRSGWPSMASRGRDRTVLRQLPASCIHSGCIRRKHDAAEATKKRSDEGRCHCTPVVTLPHSAGLVIRSLPVRTRGCPPGRSRSLSATARPRQPRGSTVTLGNCIWRVNSVRFRGYPWPPDELIVALRIPIVS
jgi:hypothetical protein